MRPLHSTEAKPQARVEARIDLDGEGKPQKFTLTLGEETIWLDVGSTWIQADRYKWVTRGLIEGPQSFRVLPDCAVEINGEKIHLGDAEACAKLEHEINKHHTAATPHKPAGASSRQPAGAAAHAARDKVRFKVKLDQLGHLMVECFRFDERVDTGLRGLHGLIENELMLRPRSMHVHPLQEWMDLDGVRYACSEEGARQLEAALNQRYAPSLKGQQAAIEIRDNPGAATGFDIRFVTVRAGAKFETKGHLTQEKLDFLQDPSHCDLLQPGIVLRLSPPNLIIRRKRPDGGEEHLPEFPDVQYRRITASQLEKILNHPSIRRDNAGGPVATIGDGDQPDIAEMRVMRHPQDHLLLWLECVPAHGGEPSSRALTHHNIADLQASGVFLPHLDISLSLDNHTLSILDTQSEQENRLTLDDHTSDVDLQRAGSLLTAALKPPAPRERPPSLDAPAAAPLAPPVQDPPAASPPATVGSAQAGPTLPPGPHAPLRPPEPEPDWSAHPLAGLFPTGDPLRVNAEIFRRLAPQFGVPVQEVSLSLPRVFENRRFDIVSFSHPAIESILDLRGESFYGFYLAYISEQRIDFVYACYGRHIEWGPDKCVVQSSLSAEPAVFRGSGLLGLAQNADQHFVFIVTPAYRQWIAPHEKAYEEACAHFITVPELLAAPTPYALIWPEPPSSADS